MWYKFTFRYGGGHQGYSEEYECYCDKLSKSDKESQWEIKAIAGRYIGHVVGECRLVKKLPAKIREEKVQGYRNDIEHAKEMLKLLKGGRS